MIIYRNNLLTIFSLIEKLGQFHFSITTQYKFLKIKKILKEEIEIYNEQLSSLNSYFERNEDGNLIINENGFKVKAEFLKECEEKINEINNSYATIPDIYFSLDELEQLKLTLNELEVLEPFIKK